ncbi:kininogen-1 [Sphaerodactylus townsendi]|uniref:kininogen-1 n=1 Tax=Sphaerodactylus townsendi TaxID=933632 RepID=UPI0020261FBE|nr:kininogen-1 [Sphaerodactylus townsendi]
MKFFVLLVLSFCCCHATPLPAQEVDCNDPDVFNAVDLALKKLNGARTHGNQFALVVVTEARRTDAPGTSFLVSVKYKITETVCAVGEEIPWQKCEFREPLEAESGECSAEIYIDNFINFSNVSQECRIVPGEGKVTASRATCTGCRPHHRLAAKTTGLLEQGSGILRKPQRSQVVAGWNYAFEYLVQETNCSKAEFPDLTPACKRIPEGRIGKCVAVAHINMTKGLSYAVQECGLQVMEDVVSPSRSCPGCPRSLETNSSKLEMPMKAALEKYNLESNDEAYYKVEEISKATAQVVAGTKYDIEFIIVKTNCSKADFQELNEDCSPKEGGEKLQCTASIHVIPWKSEIFPNVTCEPHQHRRMSMFYAWPPGMTPFRAFAMRHGESPPFTESEQTAGSQTAPLPSSRKRLGAAPSRESRNRQGPTKEPTKDQPSKESHEDGNKQEETSPEPVVKTLEDQLAPAKPCGGEEEPNENGARCPKSDSQQDSSESSDFSVSDLFPEPDAPKCPGKPWKPVTAPRSTEPEVPIGAEADAEQQEPAQEDFNLADALSLY